MQQMQRENFAKNFTSNKGHNNIYFILLYNNKKIINKSKSQGRTSSDL